MKAMFQVTLYDNMNQTDSFFVTIKDGVCETSNSQGTLLSHTHIAVITPINQNAAPVKIDGDAWRDIDASDSIGEFIQRVIMENNCGDNYLAELASQLNLSPCASPGSIIPC